MSPHDQGAGCIWLTRLLPDLAASAGSCISVLPSAGDACTASLAPGRLRSGDLAPLRRHQSVGRYPHQGDEGCLPLYRARPLLSGLDLESSPEQTGGPSPFGAVAGGAGGYKRGRVCPCCSATARPYGDHSQPGAWVATGGGIGDFGGGWLEPPGRWLACRPVSPPGIAKALRAARCALRRRRSRARALPRRRGGDPARALPRKTP